MWYILFLSLGVGGGGEIVEKYSSIEKCRMAGDEAKANSSDWGVSVVYTCIPTWNTLEKRDD